MKRYICLIISLCLVFGSFSFVFATATSWDTSDQANLQNAASRLYYNGYSAAYYLKQIADRVSALSSIASDITTIKGYLFDDGHSIGYWTSAISSYMSPIYNAILNSVDDTDIEPIVKALHNPNPGATSTWGSFADIYNNAHRNLFIISGNAVSPLYYVYTIGDQGAITQPSINWNYGTPIGNLALIGVRTNANLVKAFGYIKDYGLGGFNSPQNAVNWGNLGTSSFTPTSSTNGIYSWLSAIQAPVARLSYVFANQEDIEARDYAAANQQVVVDEFIDPNGQSSASTNDIGSISDLSSGYQQNFGSTASVSGIFDIFDSNNFGWFSSETYQQLDTTVAQRGSSFETPLLDQQLEDISRALGVDYAN